MKIDPAMDMQLPGILVMYSYDNDRVNIIEIRIDTPPAIKKNQKIVS